MPARVSVVIPCYRQAHFLPDAIHSVLAQTRPAHQIIVVDDGSPDNVHEVVRGYQGVALIRQDNQGLGPARNRGLADCTGDFVVFLDADDRLLPRALQTGAEALLARPECGFVWGRKHLFGADGVRLASASTETPSSTTYRQLLLDNFVGAPASVMFRRSVLEGVGGFWPLRLPVEDYDLYLRIARLRPIFFHGEYVAEYRQHHQNMSADLDRMLEGKLKALERQEEPCREDRSLQAALRIARRQAVRRHDRATRLQGLTALVRERRWSLAVASAAALVTRHPGAFPELLASLARKIGRF